MASCQDADDISTDASPEDRNNSKSSQGDLKFTKIGKNGKKSEFNLNCDERSNVQIGDYNFMEIHSGPQKPRKRQTQKRKKPITTSTAEPTKKQLDLISNHTGKDWRKLGRKLGLSDGQLDSLKIQYKAEGQYEVVYQLLRSWKSEFYPVDVNKLAQACDSIGRGDLSDLLS